MWQLEQLIKIGFHPIVRASAMPYFHLLTSLSKSLCRYAEECENRMTTTHAKTPIDQILQLHDDPIS